LFTVRFWLRQVVATHVINNDADMLAQERADGIAVQFGTLPTAWIAPMKNLMNPIWKPVGFSGVNYFTFAGPSSVFGNYSERSNPASRYYQAWFGAYVAKPDGGVIPNDLSALAIQIASLDQRSWLEAVGDSHPVADSGDGSSGSQRSPPCAQNGAMGTFRLSALVRAIASTRRSIDWPSFS
jgi:hypothetical protein